MPAAPFRFTITQTRRALRAGVPAGRVREMRDGGSDRDEYRAEVKAAEARLVSVPLSDGTDALLAPELVAGFRGLDGDRDVIIVGWKNADGSEYRVPLTPCCHASASIDDSGEFYCKGCYGPADAKFGGEADPIVSHPTTPPLNTTDSAPAPADAATPTPQAAATAPKGTRMSRSKSLSAAEQYTAMGLTDPAVWTPAMNLAVKQKWSNLPVDVKVDDLRGRLASVEAPTVESLDALTQRLGTLDAAKAEHARLLRNAKVNAWRARNQIQAALDARELKFAAMRGKRQLVSA